MDSLDAILIGLIVLSFALVGACLGSFSSAIAYRVARQKSWIVEKSSVSGARQPARSFCPECHHQLSVLDLIPVLSWVFLRGRCRYCKANIPARYPVIEVCGAMAMVGFFFAGAGKLSLLLFVITLPFCLAFCLLFWQRSRPPFYLYGLFFVNIFVLLYAIIWGDRSLGVLY